MKCLAIKNKSAIKVERLAPAAPQHLRAAPATLPEIISHHRVGQSYTRQVPKFQISTINTRPYALMRGGAVISLLASIERFYYVPINVAL